ncbi:Avt7p [Ascoidea rubescens DSM 1968]|uniref:Vacuolar amino acid transporter 7 n=1 Tax=Ascoidea rubescens DSM 1968 TaxID=1344418 RepID=A0A1D2VEH6_9ASCO|nr:vacuolar amino acid transporter 7 [Ascoidea rubescens DSM 1968]ODV60051.1 vacuolar amino acid transporter 7 [Ascoidea rubescens DSM 1968]
MIQASTKSSIISLTKTVVGAGALAMPFAFRADGLFFGILIILLASVTSGFGLYLQARTSKYVPDGNATFFAICSITYPKLSVIFDFAIAIQCFGVGLSYLIIIGDLLPDLSSNHLSRTSAILVSSILICPLSFLKNLDSLKYTSIIGLISISYIIILVFLHFLFNDIPQDLKGEINYFKPLNLSSILSTFSIIIFAYTGHQNMYSLINESSNKSIKNLSYIVKVVILISTAIFFITGISGYLTFGNNVKGNVLLMYPDSRSTRLARFALSLMVILSFPLMFHPCRISANNIYHWIKINYFSTNNDLDPPVVPFPNLVFIIITSLLLVASYLLAISINSFALVLSLVGATGSTAISFILPGLFGYKLLGNSHNELLLPNNFSLSSGYNGKWIKYASLLLSIWGIIVMFLCVTATLFIGDDS